MAKEATVRFQSSTLGLALSIVLAGAAGVAARAQTDVGLNLYGTFSGATNNNNIRENPADAAGVMIEVRHIRNPLIGYEATYSFNRANQEYTYTGFVGCPAPGPCPIPTEAVSANAQEITGDWIISAHARRFRPFALAGAGVLINEAINPCVTGPGTECGGTGIQNATTGVFVYGAGLDWGLLPHIGLRFQYRGNVYKAPTLTNSFGSSVDAFKHTAEPMIGVYFRF
jgi:opacity protein-like surface antigen